MKPERLAEIRENDAFAREIRGEGWDDHTTDAEIDRADLLAAFDTVSAELAEARAAIERVRMLCTQAQKPDLGSWPMPADVDCDDVLAALDASQRPEDTREPAPKMRAVSVESPGNDGFRYEPAPEHTDRHGRSWDRHPFVKSSRVGDDVPECVCGLTKGHDIHQPAPEGGGTDG